MRKLFFDKLADDKIITITGDDHKHIAFSLRMRRGDEIVICHNATDYTAKIIEITKDKTVVEVVGKAHNNSEPNTQITLFFGALKGDKNDYIVQKCTELGVSRLVPFISQFSSVNKESVKIERLNKIALEAAKQSGRGVVPAVDEVSKLNDLYDLLRDYDLVIFPYEHEEQVSLMEFLSTAKRGKTAIVIGSEGGFSTAEAQSLREIAGASVTLGERILRADTACVAVLAATMYSLGEWSRK